MNSLLGTKENLVNSRSQNVNDLTLISLIVRSCKKTLVKLKFSFKLFFFDFSSPKNHVWVFKDFICLSNLLLIFHFEILASNVIYISLGISDDTLLVTILIISFSVCFPQNYSKIFLKILYSENHPNFVPLNRSPNRRLFIVS